MDLRATANVSGNKGELSIIYNVREARFLAQDSDLFSGLALRAPRRIKSMYLLNNVYHLFIEARCVEVTISTTVNSKPKPKPDNTVPDTLTTSDKFQTKIPRITVILLRKQ